MCFSFRPSQPPLSLAPVDQCRCCSSKSLTILKCRSLINPWTELRFSPWLQAHRGHQGSLYPHHRKQDTACQMQPSLLEKVFPKVVPTSSGSSQMASLAPGWCPPKRVAHCCSSPGPVAVAHTYLIFFSVSCSRAEWQSSISLTKSRFLFSAFSRSCLALSRSRSSCSTCPLPWKDRWDAAVSLTDFPEPHSRV